MDDSEKRDWELMELLSAAWDDHLDESSHKRLEELLAQDEGAAVRLLTKFTRMHVELEWLISSDAAQRKALDAIRLAKGEAARTNRWRLAGRPLIGLAAAAAAVLLVFVGGWLYTSGRLAFRASGRSDAAGTPMARPAMPLGRIVANAGVRWGEGRQLRDGQTLLEGQVIDLAEGTVRISMDFGAELVLEAPCRATLIASDMVTLESGKIAVKVADWGHGFKIRTNDLLVTDVGTRFVVQADARAGSEAHVLEGLVIASALKQSMSPRRLGAGQAVRTNAEGGLDSVAFRREAFADKLAQSRPLRTVKLANSGVGLHEGDQDQHWLIKAGNPGFGPYPQHATVCPAKAMYGSNAPARSQWISVKEGTTSGVPVRTKYAFETNVDLTGFDPSTVRLTGFVLADNGVEEIRLNGRPLPIAPWNDWYAEVTFFAFHTIEITDGFVAGNNVISFVVTNDTDLPDPGADFEPPQTPNPMALRVEWQASGRPR